MPAIRLCAISTNDAPRIAFEMESDLCDIRDLAGAIELIARNADIGKFGEPIETICRIIKEKTQILDRQRRTAAGQDSVPTIRAFRRCLLMA
jgi:hypothetical protein